MDIQYLLFLQDFRNSIDNALTPFMEGVSMFAVTYLILFPVYYYWNRNKKDGLYALVAYYFCMVITPLVKLTACVYRPWIRDSRIVPAGKAIVTATGYSFPSGHTTTAAPLAGGRFICGTDSMKVPSTTAMRIPNMYWPVQKNRSIQTQSCACSAGMKESYLYNLKKTAV